MRSANRSIVLAASGLWRRFLVLIPLVVAMAIVCYVHIRSVCSTYRVWTLPWAEGEPPADFHRFGIADVHIDNPGVVRVVDVTYGANGAACITLESVADGATDVSLGDETLSDHWYIVVRDGAVLGAGVNFSGWEYIHGCLCILFVVVAVLCGSILVRLQRTHFFGYGMVAACGGMLFFAAQALLFTVLLVRGSMRDFTDLAFMLASAADAFALFGLIPMAVLAVLVSASNIALIRHEGMRLVNLLGIVASLLLLAAAWLWYVWWDIAAATALPVEAVEVIDTMLTVALAYGECLLLATMFCAWIASRQVPKGAVDYLVVLGCGLRGDGTPSPLLAGRVDRARAFDAACVQNGGAPTTFVPSGGQGPDEVMSEAQSMRNYLVTKGVDPDRIVLEGRSSTTRENMAFSREVIEAHAGCDASEVSVGFSTTNYHVFRGYVCAHQAGMVVQGMGSKTRAYFWPNAFLREFLGLLAARWKGILLAYLTIAAVYALAEHVLIVM